MHGHGLMGGWMGVWVGGRWVDGWVDRWVDRWVGGWVDGAPAGMPFLDFFRTLPRVLWIARAVRWPLHHSPGRRQCAWRGAGGGWICLSNHHPSSFLSCSCCCCRSSKLAPAAQRAAPIISSANPTDSMNLTKTYDGYRFDASNRYRIADSLIESSTRLRRVDSNLYRIAATPTCCQK